MRRLSFASFLGAAALASSGALAQPAPVAPVDTAPQAAPSPPPVTASPGMGAPPPMAAPADVAAPPGTVLAPPAVLAPPGPSWAPATWTPGAPVPAGYRIRAKHQLGKTVAGAALLGLGYTATTLIGSRIALSGFPGIFLAPQASIPVFGAFALGGTSPFAGVGPGTMGVLLGLGVVQSVGLGVMVSGLRGRTVEGLEPCPSAPPRTAAERFDAGRGDAPGAAQFRKKKRMIISGSVVLGLSYYASILTGSIAVTQGNRGSKDYIGALFPIAGPFVTGVLRAIPNAPQEADYAGTAYNFALGAGQVLGAGLLIGGILQPTGTPPPEPSCAGVTVASARGGGGEGDGGGAVAGEGRGSRGFGEPSETLPFTIAPIVTPSFAGAGIIGTF